MLTQARRIGLLATLVVATGLPGAAQTAQGLAPAPAERTSYYAAGESITVPTVVSGDVVVAGRTITLSNAVEGDVLAAGWHVSLSGPALDDVRVAGQRVEIAGPIAGDLTAAGGELFVGPAARVAGRAWLTGGVVEVKGTFERELRLAGGTVRLGGEFRQPVHVTAETLEVLPDARLLGALSYESPKPATIAGTAAIAGPIAYRAITPREARDAHAFRVVSSVFFALSLILAGWLFMWLMPAAASALVGTMRNAPGRSALLGLALLVGVPIAALLLIATLVGMPIGVAAGALYAVALLVGIIVAALRIGEWEAGVFRWTDIGSPRQRRLALVAGVLTLAAIRVVPVFGTLAVFVSTVVGLGALGLTLAHASKAAPATLAS